jgi:spore coat protein A
VPDVVGDYQRALAAGDLRCSTITEETAMEMTTNPAAPRSGAPDARDAVEQAASVTPLSELGLTKFLDPLRIPPVIAVPAHRHRQSLSVTMRAAQVKLHSQLPSTRVWTYDGSFPGPTIEVHRGQKLRLTWENAITGSYPVTAVELPIQNETAGPGRDGAKPRADVAALPPWTVVHLHGGRTNAANDGWAENAVLPGGAQLSEYPNEQRASTLWYHDHAMGVTSLNMMAGLMGMYLLRDDEEDALHLPHGRREVPLILCDRNLDTDVHGNLTGELLYKTKITPDNVKIPFTGPFTLVNGVIWPHLNVDACWYRFRVVNASNFRPYGLELHDEHDAPIAGALHQIGTDGGLLPAPAALSRLTLAPGERADILIDFSAFRGRSLRLANTLTPAIPGPTSPNPDVMQFRVRAAMTYDDFTLPDTISPSFVRLTHDALPKHHAHRWLALTLLDKSHPELWEMVEIDHPPAELPVDGIVQVKLANGKVTTLQRITRSFGDGASFYVEHNGWELWNILNLSTVNHPIHLHLVQFQTVGHGRERFNIHSFDTAVGGTITPVTYEGPGTLDASDQGWKDTIRVGRLDGGELVSIAAQFNGGTGRYMYHCHILEHEDEGMMRTFVVKPKEAMALDPMGNGQMDHEHPPHVS